MAGSARTRPMILAEVRGHLDGARSVLLSGDIGVGKSHLARMIAADRPEEQVELLIGSPAIRAIPFAAVAHLVPDRTISDPLRLLQLTRRALEERSGGRKLLIVIDDLDQIDSGTMALVHQLAVDRAAAVLATVRSTKAARPEIAALWKDDHLVRVELTPLARGEHDDMITEAAPTEVNRSTLERIWELTQGNPLFAREIIYAMETSGSFEGDASVSEAVLGSTRLRDRVEHRLAGLSSDERDIVASVALTEPLSADVIHALFAPATVSSLEERELLRSERTQDDLAYRTAHPLFGELVRQSLAPGVRDRLLLAVVGSVLESAEVDPARDFRVASWLLDADLPITRELGAQAALGALRVFDPASAARFAESAMAGEPDLRGLTTYGVALSQLGKVDEADKAFAEAERLATDEPGAAGLTVLRSMNLIHHGGRIEEGVALLHGRADSLRDPIARANVESMLMQGEGVNGDFSRALRLGPELAVEARGGGISELRLLVSMSVARVVTGQLDNAEAEIERGLAVAAELADTYPVEADQMMLGKLLYLLTVPDVDAGLTLVLDRLAGASGAGEAPWLYLASWFLSAAGNLESAQRAAVAGVELLDAVDPIGLQVLALGAHAMVQAQAGQVEGSKATLARAMADPRCHQPRSRMWLSRAEAWEAAHSQGPRAGAEVAANHGAALAQVSHETWGAWVAYDAVRFGHGDAAVHVLEEIAAESRDGAVRLFAAHARAQVNGDPKALATVAHDWEAAGAWAHAAEAHAHGSAASRSGTLRARHCERAIVIRDRCDGLSSPALNGLESPLSARQRELARLAAAGQSSRAIAAELFLSRRTVDNHLGSVYAVLGVAGRSELPAIFGTTHSVADDYSSAL